MKPTRKNNIETPRRRGAERTRVTGAFAPGEKETNMPAILALFFLGASAPRRLVTHFSK